MRLCRYGQRHGEPADVPDEPGEFAGDGNHCDVLLLAARDKLPIAPAQAHLRVPGAINNGLRNAFMPALDLGTDTGRVLVAPGRFDQQLSCIAVAVLGDAALTALAARRVFAGG